MRLNQWIMVGAAGLLTAGCAANDVVIKRQAEMEARIEQLVQGYAGANAKLTDISAELKELQSQVRKTAADLEEVKPVVMDMKSAVESVQQRQSEQTKTAGAVPAAPAPEKKIEVINKESAPADKANKAQDAYMKAFGLFSANNYKQAIEAFEAFITKFPDSEYAGNARYWIGECYYTQRDFKQALESFRKVLADYPKGNKAPDAMLKLGLTQISLKEPAKAKETFQNLIDKYSKSPAAAKAKERLTKL